MEQPFLQCALLRRFDRRERAGDPSAHLVDGSFAALGVFLQQDLFANGLRRELRERRGKRYFVRMHGWSAIDE